MRVERKGDYSNATLPPLEDLAELIAEGYSTAEIAEKFGVRTDTVRRKFERYGVSIRDIVVRQTGARKPEREGAMTFTTSTGYVCSMPRVSILMSEV